MVLKQGLSAMRKMIAREIEKERERQKIFRSGVSGRLTATVILMCFVINVEFLLRDPQYPILFIIASFYLFMIYFITLFIPLERQSRGFDRAEIVGFFKKLIDNGFIRGTERFSRVFLNAFFINCVPLFRGFALIFSVDILFTVLTFSQGSLSATVAFVILFQSTAIILFYYFVWKLEPYSSEFFADMHTMHQRLIQKRIPSRVVTAVFWVGGILALIGAFLAVILLPGFTVKQMLSIPGLTRLGDLFIAIVILCASQYFILRYLHGDTSRVLAEKFSANKAKYLSRQVEVEVSTTTSGDSELQKETMTPDTFREATAILLESRIYQVERKTILGAFPVYIVNPDFSVALDQDTLDTLIHLSPVIKDR